MQRTTTPRPSKSKRRSDLDVLPFYILHYLPIRIVGFYVVQWEVCARVRYVVIVLSSLVATLLLYEIGARRWRMTRFLFGMKPCR
jgi:hypothetical protein